MDENKRRPLNSPRTSEPWCVAKTHPAGCAAAVGLRSGQALHSAACWKAAWRWSAMCSQQPESGSMPLRILRCSSKRKQTKQPEPYLSGRRTVLLSMTAPIVRDTFRQGKKIRVAAKRRRCRLSTIWEQRVARISPGRARQLRKFRVRSTRNHGPFLPLLRREAAQTQEQVTPGLWKISYPVVSRGPDTTRNERCQ